MVVHSARRYSAHEQTINSLIKTGVKGCMNKKTFIFKFSTLSSILSKLGAAALAGMMILTVIDVAGRYLFNTPVLGAFELTEFLVLILIFSFLAYTQSQKRHICVEILADLLPKKIQFASQLINYVISIALFALIACMGTNKAIELMETGESSPNLVIPNYPFALFLALGAFVMCVEYAKDIIVTLTKGKEESN